MTKPFYMLLLIVFTSLCFQFDTSILSASEDLRIAGQKKRRSKRKSSKRRTRRTNNKVELSRALQLAKAKQYEAASKLLFSLSRNPKYRSERSQIRYILGLMLFEMGLYQSAGYQFVAVVQSKDTRYLDKALSKLSFAADALNDATLLNFSMSRVNLKKFPISQRDLLRYRIGEFQYKRKKYNEATRNLSRVSPRSNVYAKAKYLEGLANAELNQVEDAVTAFRLLEKTTRKDGVTDSNRVDALMGIARSLYQAKDWGRSIDVYRQVPKDTPQFHDSLFEMSWALMRSAKFRSVLSNFHSLHSSYYEDFYIPESLLLRSIVYLYICQYDEMEKTLDLFENLYQPVSNQLKKYLRSKPKPESYYEALNEVRENEKELYLDPKQRKKYSFPFVVASRILDEGDVKSTQYYIDQLKTEQRIIEGLSSDWQNSSIGAASRKLIGRRLRAARRRIGLQIKRHAILINRDLDRLFEQQGFARFEMANAKKERIRKKQSVAKSVESDRDRDFYIQNGYEYYPFQGEYWIDEIGNYQYLGKSSCQN